MEFQVWTKEEFEGWQKIDCGDKPAALREIEKAIRAGKEPLLTATVPFDVSIKIEEAKLGETTKSKTKPDKDTGSKSDSSVRSGDAGATEKLD